MSGFGPIIEYLSESIATGLYVDEAGDTMSGPLDMGTYKITGLGDPTLLQDAVTKNYVDTEISGISLPYVDESGDTMTGALTINKKNSALFVGNTATIINIAGVSYLPTAAFTSETDLGNEIPLGFQHFGNTALLGSILGGARARGTIISPTVVQSGDTLLGLSALGYDGIDYSVSSQINFDVVDTPGAGNIPAGISFLLHATGDVADMLSQGFRIEPSRILVGRSTTVTTALSTVHLVADNTGPIFTSEIVDTAVGAGDDIFVLNIIGGEAGGRGIVAQLLVETYAAWTDTSSPTKITLSTTPLNSTAIGSQAFQWSFYGGNLGCGAPSPSAKVHIRSTKNPISDLNDPNDYTLLLDHNQDLAGGSCGIGFVIDTSSTNVMGPAIIAERTGDNSKAHLHFYTKQATDTSDPIKVLTLGDDGSSTFAGNVFVNTIKSGATQVAAGAVANELWKTNGHASLPDNVVMIGI